MRELFFGICMLFGGVRTLAQNANNSITVFANTSLSFILDDPSKMEQDQTLNNAITIRVASKKKDVTVSAKLAAFTYPFGFVPASNMLQIKWVSDNSNKDYNLVTNPISLQALDQPLFSQEKMKSNVQYYDYIYDFILKSQGYLMIPGNYNFSVLFTMTQN
ncbi:MAG: hypothetical protein JST52_01240 [Bacteroidetes bacterium]|nr:hypothetical protein [Bacteroidota bacterium]MBS1739210.1 hypothetical protein [Bacteroidota bacterium]